MITTSPRTAWLTQVVLGPAASKGRIQGEAVGNGEGRDVIRGLPGRQGGAGISLKHGRPASVSGTALACRDTQVVKIPVPLDIAVIGLA